MQIEIKADDIDNYVKEAIIKSSLGQAIHGHIDKAVKEIVTGYNSPIQGIVKSYISDIVEKYMLEDKNKDVIKEAVAKILTPETIEKIVVYGVRKFEETIKDYNSDRGY